MRIVLPIALALILSACSDENKNSITKVESPKSVPIKKVKAVVSVRTGPSLYVACAACHGADGLKIALGKSQIIKGWDSKKVINALNGYKDGTYGGSMKGIMKGQVSALSDEDIKAVSEYISKL
ncbi:MAG: c-type cytochrome [Sulfurimonas sp.]|nr:c-type cytochrome [Sulfurimonas sp.]